MTLETLLIILLILALVGWFVPAGGPYRPYTGPVGLVVLVILVVVLLRGHL